MTQTLAEKIQQNKVDIAAEEARIASLRAEETRAKHDAAVAAFLADAKTYIIESIEAGKTERDLKIRLGHAVAKVYPDSPNCHLDVVAAFKLSNDESPDTSIARSEYAAHWNAFVSWGGENGLSISMWREARGYGQFIDARWFEVHVDIKASA